MDVVQAVSIATVCAVIALCRINVYPITSRIALEALSEALTVGKIEMSINNSLNALIRIERVVRLAQTGPRRERYNVTVVTRVLRNSPPDYSLNPDQVNK